MAHLESTFEEALQIRRAPKTSCNTARTCMQIYAGQSEGTCVLNHRNCDLAGKAYRYDGASKPRTEPEA